MNCIKDTRPDLNRQCHVQKSITPIETIVPHIKSINKLKLKQAGIFIKCYSSGNLLVKDEIVQLQCQACRSNKLPFGSIANQGRLENAVKSVSYQGLILVNLIGDIRKMYSEAI